MSLHLSKMFAKQLLLVFIIYCTTQADRTFSDRKSSDFGLDVIGQLENNGYPVEVHTVVTADGYILQAHRIPRNKSASSASQPGPPVLLISGIFCTSTDWVSSGANHGLAYLLSDEGYDVWLANYRGTTFGRNHTTLNPNKDKKFWDFSANEIAHYDTPSWIDYMLETTGQETFFYIGYSQGGMTIYQFLDEKPEYNEKIRLMALLAPGSFDGHARGFFSINPVLYGIIVAVLDVLHIYELLPHTPPQSFILTNLCNPRSPLQVLCHALWFFFAGYSPDQLDKERLPTIVQNFPAGDSVNQVTYFVQLYRAGQVVPKYDYGKKENVVRYGQETPPIFNISLSTAPTAFFSGGRDIVIAAEDTAVLAEMFPNVVSKIFVEGFSHFDFLFGLDAKERVYDPIMQIMRRF